MRAACAALLGAAMLMLSAGCRLGRVLVSSTGVEEGNAERLWTFLVYMNGDNELEAQAIKSLNELEAVDPAGVTVLALVDRAVGYDTSNGDWTGTRLFEVRYDGGGDNAEIVSTPLASSELGLTVNGDEELDMGDPVTLRRFLAFAATHYPAQHTALFLWGHGSGWRAPAGDGAAPADGLLVRAVSFDDASASDPLYTEELSEALADHSVDILAFDCCCEAMIEIAYQVRACASTMLASEDVTAAEGWSYRELLARVADSDGTPAGVLEAAVEAFAACQADTAGATISAVDLGGVDAVMSALNGLSDALWAWIGDTPSQTEIRTLLFNEVEDFYRIPGDLDLDLADLARIVGERIPEVADAAAALAEAVDEAVLLEWHHSQGNPRAGGMAVHFVPLSADGTAAVHADAYFRGFPANHPLAFVADSTWVPQYPTGPGLLYRLWYEVF